MVHGEGLPIHAGSFWKIPINAGFRSGQPSSHDQILMWTASLRKDESNRDGSCLDRRPSFDMRSYEEKSLAICDGLFLSCRNGLIRYHITLHTY